MRLPYIQRIKPAARRLSKMKPPPVRLPKMSLLSLLFFITPIVCSFAALVLTALCMSAGSGSYMGSLELLDIYTLNTSRIGFPFISTHMQTHISNLTNTTIYTLPALYPNTISDSNTTAGRLLLDFGTSLHNSTHSIARYLGLYSFYSVHMQNYCEGNSQYPWPTPKTTATPHKSTTKCAPSRRLFYFLPQPLLTGQLTSGASNLTLPQLNWDITTTSNHLHTLRAYFRSSYILYIFSLTLLALSSLAAIIKAIDHGRSADTTSNYAWFATAACIFLITASACVTVGAKKSVAALNQNRNVTGLQADMGKGFQGVTWSAVAVMLGAEGGRVCEWVVERRRVRAWTWAARELMAEAKAAEVAIGG